MTKPLRIPDIQYIEQSWKRRRYARVDLMLHKACTKRSDGTCIHECHMKSLHARSHECHMKSLHECHVRNVTYRCMQHVWSHAGVQPCMYGAGVVVENVARYLQVLLSCRLLEGSRFEERMHWYAAYRVFLLSRMSCRSLVRACVANTMED